MYPTTPIIIAHFEGIYSMLKERVGKTARDIARDFSVVPFDPFNNNGEHGMREVISNILTGLSVGIEVKDLSSELYTQVGHQIFGYRGRVNEEIMKPLDWYVVDFIMRENFLDDVLFDVYKIPAESI